MSQRFWSRWARPFMVAVLVSWAADAAAAPNDWAEGTAGANDGATRDFYNRGAMLPWRVFNGDWVDQADTEHGDTAWATTTVTDTDATKEVTWDVADLVQSWIDADQHNHGFFLRATSGGGPIDFSSRDHATSSQHPQLDVTIGGATTTLDAEADTFLEPSTYTAQGNEDRLRVGSDNNALVRFDLSGQAGQVQGATLRMTTTAQYGDTDIGVFLPDPGRSGPPPAFDIGIGEDYPDDAGIADHADVVFFADFEAADWMDHWSQHGGSFDIADGDSSFGFEPLLGKALRAWIPEGENTGLNTSFEFMTELGEEPEEIYFRYYVRLGDDWNQTVDGGKMPGIAGTYGVAGWGGRPSHGDDGWSARGLFRTSVPPGNNPLGGYTPIGSYVYHADMEGQYGDNFIWVEGWGEEGYGAVLDTNRWYCVETYVKMNTLGQNDGILRGWIDGRLSQEKTDFRFRDVDSLKIEEIWMNVYHGGTDVSPYDQHLFIDNVVVAHSYIGPMGGEPPDPGDTGTGTGDGGSGSGDGGGGSGTGGGTGHGTASDGGGTSTGSGSGAADDGDGGCSCHTRQPCPAMWLLAVVTCVCRRRRPI